MIDKVELIFFCIGVEHKQAHMNVVECFLFLYTGTYDVEVNFFESPLDFTEENPIIVV